MNLISQLEEMGLAIVALVFLWAAVAKLMSKNDLKMTLWSIPHFPAMFVSAIALLLPLVEIGIAIGLVVCSDFAKWAAIALLLSFCLLAIVVIKAKLKVPCNCFGSSDRLFSRSTIIQNTGLILLICLGIPVKHAEDIPFDILAAMIVLATALSVATLWTNRRSVNELQYLHIIGV